MKPQWQSNPPSNLTRGRFVACSLHDQQCVIHCVSEAPCLFSLKSTMEVPNEDCVFLCVYPRPSSNTATHTFFFLSRLPTPLKGWRNLCPPNPCVHAVLACFWPNGLQEHHSTWMFPRWLRSEDRCQRRYSAFFVLPGCTQQH